MVSMNRLPKAKQIQVVAALVEGCSIRATVRMTGVAKNTIVKLLAELGAACEAYQIGKLVNLPCKRLQCDCGYFDHRDANAAHNIRALGKQKTVAERMRNDSSPGAPMAEPKPVSKDAGRTLELQ